VAIDPTASLAWGQSGFWKNGRRDTDGAISDFNRAIRLEGARTPLASRLAGIGCAHFIAGRYRDSALWLRRALAANPDAISINRNLAATYVMLGEKQAARAALDALRRAYPGATLARLAVVIPPGCRDRTLEALASIGLPP
jgi:adenylate cyclase